jgi:hypothetical protein
MSSWRVIDGCQDRTTSSQSLNGGWQPRDFREIGLQYDTALSDERYNG